MTEFEIGDLVYVKHEIRENGILISRFPPVPDTRIGVAARIEYLTEGSAASIKFEYDGWHTIISPAWLGHWRDFATIKEVEDYLDD